MSDQHAGVFIEERRSGQVSLQGVSTSNFATVAGFDRGPVDQAVFCASFEQGAENFGSFSLNTLGMHGFFAFTAQGGRRGYLVRVVASDATTAAAAISNDVVDLAIEEGDGTTKTFTKLAGASLLALNVRPGTLLIKYKEAGTAVVAAAQTVEPAIDGTALRFVFRLGGVGTRVAVVPGTVTITTTEAATPVLYTDPAKDGLLKNAGTTYGRIDYASGFVTIAPIAPPDAASSIKAGYTPVSTERTITDDGLGALSGSTLSVPGTVDYETGAYSFTIALGSKAPYDQGDVRATYTQDAWAVPAISAGAWGENLKMELVGNDDYFTTATGVYSRFDLRVFLRDDADSAFVLKETFSALDFEDENSNSYAPVVVNDPDTGSKLIELTDPPFDATGPSGQLNARARTAVLGVGNRSLTAFGSTSGSTAELVIGTASPIVTAAHRADPLTASVQPRTVRIVYRANGDTVDRVITDDGSGNLTGDVGTGTNKVNYDTGHLAFVTSAAPDVSGLISCTYSLTPTETASEELFDGGSDGVAGVGRTEMTSPSLKAAKRGMYALTTVDEFLNLGIMDLAGNVTCALDQQTEAETNQRWFVVLCTPSGMTPQQAKDYRRNTLGINSSYCALYYPWVRIADPVRNRNVNIPPLGHVIGVYARTDANKSVGKAPAGTEDGKLLFSTGLERNLTFDELDILDPNGVNALIDTPQTGRVVWGASTLESPPADFEFVHARRLFIFLERSTFNGSFPFVWENIGPSLWSRVKTSMESLLYNVWQSGALKGDTQDEAFRVVCDVSNNPIEVQRAKRVVCDVYPAVNDPGKYLHFRFSKKQG